LVSLEGSQHLQATARDRGPDCGAVIAEAESRDVLGSAGGDRRAGCRARVQVLDAAAQHRRAAGEASYGLLPAGRNPRSEIGASLADVSRAERARATGDDRTACRSAACHVERDSGRDDIAAEDVPGRNLESSGGADGETAGDGGAQQFERAGAEDDRAACGAACFDDLRPAEDGIEERLGAGNPGAARVTEHFLQAAG
jgi:hypothetical protein